MIITIGQIVDFKLDYLRFSRCLGKNLVQKNSKNDEYFSNRHRFMQITLHSLQPGELMSR